MNMESLKTVQILFKIGRIISKILFVCSIVGFCGALAGIVSLSAGAPSLKFGGVTLESILMNDAGLSQGTLLAMLAASLVFSAAAGVLARFAVQYFTREQLEGTPFTFDGAREMQRLGILAVCLPIAAQIAAKIIYGIIAKGMPDVAPMDMDFRGGVVMGVMLIVMAQLCKYGAALSQGETQEI